MIVTSGGLERLSRGRRARRQRRARRHGLGGRRRAASGSDGARARRARRRRQAVDVDAVVREANAPLCAITRRSGGGARGREPELPRTEGTRKLKRRDLRDWVSGRHARQRPRRRRRHASAHCSRASPRPRRSAAATTIDELGLSSLERVELMVALEERVQTTIDEVRVRRRRRASPIWSASSARAAPTPARTTASHASPSSSRRGIARFRCVRSAARACRRGSCRSPASSRGSTSRDASTSKT